MTSSVRRCQLGLSAAAVGLLLAGGAVADDRPSLRVAVNTLPRTLDPGEEWGQNEVRVYYSIFDTLIRRDFAHPLPDGGARLVPGLAESWSWIDPTTLELKLRQGVTCHDGNPFNAEDVLTTFSPERLWGPDSYHFVGQENFRTFKSVEKVDDYTVRITTSAPDVVLEHRLSGSMSFIICDEAWNAFRKPDVDHKVWMEEAAKALRWNPVGTGPYKFAGYERNSFVKLVAFDEYYEGKPAAADITFSSVPEVATRVAGLVAGDFDIVVEIPPDQWDQLASLDDIVVKTKGLENCQVIILNMSDPVLADKKLRHALSLAIDRQALVDTLWHGKSAVPNGHQHPSFGPLYIAEHKGYQYDPELAKKLLKESSYAGQELSYRLIPNYYAFILESAQAVQEMWREIGVNVKIEFVESSKAGRGPGHQMSPWSNTFRIPDPTGGVAFSWGPDAEMQAVYKFFNASDEYNRLARSLFTLSDQTERRANFAKLLDLFEDEMPMTMLYYTVAGFAMKKNVNWEPYSQFMMDFRPSNFSIGAM